MHDAVASKKIYDIICNHKYYNFMRLVYFYTLKLTQFYKTCKQLSKQSLFLLRNIRFRTLSQFGCEIMQNKNLDPANAGPTSNQQWVSTSYFLEIILSFILCLYIG